MGLSLGYHDDDFESACDTLVDNLNRQIIKAPKFTAAWRMVTYLLDKRTKAQAKQWIPALKRVADACYGQLTEDMPQPLFLVVARVFSMCLDLGAVELTESIVARFKNLGGDSDLAKEILVHQ